MSLPTELKRVINDFDEALDVVLGKSMADEMRAYIRDRYHNIRTLEEEEMEHKLISQKGKSLGQI